MLEAADIDIDEDQNVEKNALNIDEYVGDMLRIANEINPQHADLYKTMSAIMHNGKHEPYGPRVYRVVKLAELLFGDNADHPIPSVHTLYNWEQYFNEMMNARDYDLDTKVLYGRIILPICHKGHKQFTKYQRMQLYLLAYLRTQTNKQVSDETIQAEVTSLLNQQQDLHTLIAAINAFVTENSK